MLLRPMTKGLVMADSKESRCLCFFDDFQHFNGYSVCVFVYLYINVSVLMSMCVCVCVYVCARECVCVCMYVCMHACVFVRSVGPGWCALQRARALRGLLVSGFISCH